MTNDPSSPAARRYRVRNTSREAIAALYGPTFAEPVLIIDHGHPAGIFYRPVDGGAPHTLFDDEIVAIRHE